MNQERQQKKGPGCIQWILWGCLGCVVLGAIVAFAVYKVGRGIYENSSMDPATVAAAFQEVLPGATIPPPYHGEMKTGGFGFTMLMAGSQTFASGSPHPTAPKAGPDITIMLMVYPAGSNINLDAAQKQNEQQTHTTGNTTIISKETVNLTVRGKPQPFEKLVQQTGGNRMVQYIGSLPGAGGRTVMVFFQGADKAFDEPAMQAFLHSIQ